MSIDLTSDKAVTNIETVQVVDTVVTRTGKIRVSIRWEGDVSSDMKTIERREATHYIVEFGDLDKPLAERRTGDAHQLTMTPPEFHLLRAALVKAGNATSMDESVS